MKKIAAAAALVHSSKKPKDEESFTSFKPAPDAAT